MNLCLVYVIHITRNIRGEKVIGFFFIILYLNVFLSKTAQGSSPTLMGVSGFMLVILYSAM